MRLIAGAGIGKLSTVGITLTLVLSALVIHAGTAESSDGEAWTALVLLPDGAGLGEVGDLVTQTLEEYDSFVLVDVTDTEASALEGMGAFVQAYDAGRIGIDGHEFDTQGGEPDLPAGLRVPAAQEAEWGYHIVQFKGPVKPGWVLSVERLGARVLDYVPNNAFIVDFRGPVPTSLAGLPFVQWHGPYQPAYKIQPGLMGAAGLVEVKIITFKGESLGSVLASLGKAGLGRVDYDDVAKAGVVRYTMAEDFGIVKARVPADMLPTLANLRAVQYIEPWEQMRLYNYETQAVMQTNVSGGLGSPSARRLWGLGIDGTGQIIGIADTGVDYDHNQFRQSVGNIGTIDNVTRLGNRKVIRYLPMSWSKGVDPSQDIWATRDSDAKTGAECVFQNNCTNGHGSRVSSTAAGNDVTGASSNDGVAKGAKIYFQDIGTIGLNTQNKWDDILRYIPDDYGQLFIWPYNDGARIHTNSWGSQNSDYDLEAMMVDKFVWEHPDMLVLFSNGNGGPQSMEKHDVGSPATAKSAVSVGGSNAYPSQNSVSGSSSRGPTIDGRTKPTVMAPFSGTSAVSDGDPTSNLNTGAEAQWGGTSYSAPAMAGSAALVRQYFEDGFYPNGVATPGNSLLPSAALVKAMLVASAEQMTSGAYVDSKNQFKWPNWSQGWGRPVLDNALYFPGDTRKLSVVDHTEGLTTGQSASYTFSAASPAGGFKVALVWSDYPASVGTTSALVNNLDLLVSPPGCTIQSCKYKGNFFGSFQQGYSLPAGGFDSKHPVETVYLPDWATQAGEWTVTVTAANVPAGPQPFSLVVLGDLDLGWGQVSLDREVYSESDTITIRVQDVITPPVPSITVDVQSDTETTPEAVTLTENVIGTGIWTGSISTGFGAPAGGDGILQVHDLDTVTATYSDASPAHVSTADAVIDASGPVISNVVVVSITNAAATVTWDTDESSDSLVYYGKTPLLEMPSVSSASLRVAHAVDLTGLETGTMYFFDVQSTDRFGHTTRDDNGGDHYTFTTSAKGEILLVIGDDTILPDRVGHYEDAFRAYDWSYNLWYIARSGEPPLTVLQDYKVVEWQVGLEQYPPFEPTARQLVTNYLNGGGRLYVSSHDVAWAFDIDAPSNDEYSSPSTSAWLQSTMKADWKQDPQRWSFTEGVGGRSISGAYVSCPNPPGSCIPYEPHRDGGSGDEVLMIPAGGIPESIWRDFGDTEDGIPDVVGLQWTSSLPNGTFGIGVWGGMPSKLVVNFFEFSGLNYLTSNDPTRNEVMDKTIQWLLGQRDHPDLTVSYPNGGETFAGTTANIYWNVTTFGTNVAGQAAYYSPDSGQSWFFITSLSAASRSYAWDITGIPNGCGYRVKVVAQDDGIPSLNGTDASNGDFCITRPGGDAQGPVVVPGSIVLSPNPATQSQQVTFTATVDDSLKGSSNIDAAVPAEFFIDVTGPDGTGTQMALTSPPTSPMESVDWTTLSVPWSAATHIVYVHGQDEWGNWGPFRNLQFEVLGSGPVPPQPPTNVRASLVGVATADVLVEWDLSISEPDVTSYEVWYGTSYDASTASYVFLGSVGGGVPAYTHAGAGDGDPNDYFYCVLAVNAAGSSTCAGQAAKYTRLLQAGPQLVSFPIQPASTAVDTVFGTAEYAWVRTFDACGSKDWLSYDLNKVTNSLSSVSRDTGYWVEVTAAGYWTVAGTVQASTQVTICDGWNLIGYASMTDDTVSNVLASIMPQRVDGYSAGAGPYFLQQLVGSDTMTNGFGYWVLAGVPGVVTITFA